MKAIRVHAFGGPDVLKLEEVPNPTPGAGQVLIKIEAAGVNPVETYIRAGIYGPRQFPYTPGSDSGGVVEEVGAGVTSFRAGDRVYTRSTLTGAYAEKTLCNEAQVFPLPEKISFAQGAALGVPYGTAYRALFHRARPIAGEMVLVHGASGGVGLAAVQYAVAFGLIVIATAGTETGMQLVREQGAHHVFNHRQPNYLDEIKKLTDGRGVDIILEMASHTNLGKDLPLLAKNGRVIVIGSRGPVEINPRDTMGRDADIRGMTLNNATEAELKGIHTAIVAGLRLGTLRPIIDKQFPLSEAAKAHVEILEPGTHGKIVLVP